MTDSADRATHQSMEYTNGNRSAAYRWILIAILIMLGLVIGICQEMLTPTLPNIRRQLNVSYETLGTVLSLRGVGNIIFTLSASYLYDSYPHSVNYFMISECIVSGLCTILIPWCRYFALAILVIYFQSGSLSTLHNACQLTVLREFKTKSISRMQLYHAGFGIGRLLSGFIAAPFVASKPGGLSKLTKYCNRKLQFKRLNFNGAITNMTSYSNNELEGHENDYVYAFMISGSISMLIGLVFLLSQSMVKLPASKDKNKPTVTSFIQKIHPKYLSNGQTHFGISITILIAFYYFFYLAGQSVLMPFIIVYAIDPCKEYFMSQRKATYLHSTLNGCFILSQLLTSFILDKYPAHILLSFNFLNVVFVTILCFLGDQFEIVLWVCLSGMRICNSVVYPTGTGYLNRYVIISSGFITITFIGSTIGVIVGQSIGGVLLDNFASIFIIYTCSGFMSALFIVSVVVIFLVNKFGNKIQV